MDISVATVPSGEGQGKAARRAARVEHNSDPKHDASSPSAASTLPTSAAPSAEGKAKTAPKASEAAAPAKLRMITKAELRKIKQRVAKLRKQGHDIWTEDEVEKEGYTLSESAPPPSSLIVSGKRQEESWDCGLACVRMALGVLGHNATHASLTQRLASRSVWSIDLAYLLHDYGVECEFITARVGMEASLYQGVGFYDECIAADSRRVSFLFKRASAEGVQVRQHTLNGTELWNLMRDEDTLVIALIDAAKLYSRVVPADRSATTDVPAAIPANDSATDFMGHYVMLVGLDDQRGGFLVNDPGRDEERTFVRSESLEAARLASGTDQDLILIPVYQPAPTPPEATTVSKMVQLTAEAGR